MTRITLALLVAALPIAVRAQSPADVQHQFEGGRYQQVIEAAAAEAPPAVVYLAAQSQQKLGADAAAVEVYQRLAARPDGEAWHFIGLSGLRLVQNDVDGARAAAQEAVAAAGDEPFAHYQLGLVLARQQAWNEAAAAFDAAAQLNPTLAYAYYYGGLMHYRANRPDRMANHFEQFLKLAPQAPERAEVTQTMRTLRR